MGHLHGTDVYRKLGKKIDELSMRAPWNEYLYAILKEVYSEEEADLVVKMPYGLASLDRISKITGYEKDTVRKILDKLTAKAFVMDLWVKGEYYYMIFPIVAGFLETLLMRTGRDLDVKKLSKLVHEYLWNDDGFYVANFTNSKISFMRVLPYEESIGPTDYTEVLDYEKATALVEQFDKFSLGLCTCRHEAYHRGEKACDTPLDTCSSFGYMADLWIRHNLGREVSKAQILENIARSKERGIVLSADNVKNNITFMCHCCRCCCNMLLGISKLGYASTFVTSSFISTVTEKTCTGCGNCAKACPINAVEMISDASYPLKKKKPAINETICLGCGVCTTKCNTKSITLVKRGKRVIHPETTFERVILATLERGTLQNQLFDNPASISQKYMRGFLGGFLRLTPVKKALMSDVLRSSFLKALSSAVKLQGKGWVTKL